MKVSVVETLQVQVDTRVPQEEIVLTAGLLPSHWPYRGHSSPHAHIGVRVVDVVIVKLNETIAIGDIIPWVATNSQLGLSGSGAWVREGYLFSRPHYDGLGPILFPDEGRSLWADSWETRSDGLCVPGLWHDNGRMGARSFDWLGDRWRAGKRIALTLG